MTVMTLKWQSVQLMSIFASRHTRTAPFLDMSFRGELRLNGQMEDVLLGSSTVAAGLTDPTCHIEGR
jgi:hypothetical protein